MPANCRAEAARTIAAVAADGRSLDAPLGRALERVDAGDRGLLQQLCYGTLRDYPRLDGLLRQLLGKPLKAKDADIRALLLLGIYQLSELRVPDHAALSETVNAARALKKPWATKLVNGVLRRFQREHDSLVDALEDASADAHPAWLHAAINRAWPQQARDIITANNTHPPMCLRVNSRRLSRADYRGKLAGAGLAATDCDWAPEGLRLESPVDVHRLPGFEAGEVSVQDEAAQLAAHLLDARAGHRVLDACSAPGGKACHILEREPGIAELVALDDDEQRLQRVHENLARLGLSATVRALDAREPAGLEAASFDRILVDAPCSGSGVIRRHPDIKLLRTPDDIAGFAGLQLAILRGLWPLLKTGGKLLYATCSILPEENNAVVQRFLADEPGALLQPLDVPWGIDSGGARQLLPTPQGPDGHFYAMLTRTA